MNVELGNLNCSPQVVLDFLFVGIDKICFLERMRQEETFNVKDALSSLG